MTDHTVEEPDSNYFIVEEVLGAVMDNPDYPDYKPVTLVVRGATRTAAIAAGPDGDPEITELQLMIPLPDILMDIPRAITEAVEMGADYSGAEDIVNTATAQEGN